MACRDVLIARDQEKKVKGDLKKRSSAERKLRRSGQDCFRGSFGIRGDIDKVFVMFLIFHILDN